jgi:hypothetical protein
VETFVTRTVPYLCDDYCGGAAAYVDDVYVADVFVSDTSLPETTITSATPETASTSATFELSASEQSTLKCSLDDTAFASYTSPSTYSALADGPHSFRVRATDRAGNTDPTPTQTVALSAAGQPEGTSVRFSPASVTAGGPSTMTVNVGPATLPGNYPLTITGTGPSTTHTLTITLTIERSNAELAIAASPASLDLGQGAPGTSTVQTTTTSGSPPTVGLSASGQSTGTAVSFNPASVREGDSSMMTVVWGQ